jgi:hypothetical protein
MKLHTRRARLRSDEAAVHPALTYNRVPTHMPRPAATPAHYHAPTCACRSPPSWRCALWAALRTRMPHPRSSPHSLWTSLPTGYSTCRMCPRCPHRRPHLRTRTCTCTCALTRTSAAPARALYARVGGARCRGVPGGRGPVCAGPSGRCFSRCIWRQTLMRAVRGWVRCADAAGPTPCCIPSQPLAPPHSQSPSIHRGAVQGHSLPSVSALYGELGMFDCTAACHTTW